MLASILRKLSGEQHVSQRACECFFHWARASCVPKMLMYQSTGMDPDTLGQLTNIVTAVRYRPRTDVCYRLHLIQHNEQSHSVQRMHR